MSILNRILAPFQGGVGTGNKKVDFKSIDIIDSDIRKVSTVEQMYEVKRLIEAGKSNINIQLTADIDFNGQNWQPISIEGSVSYSGVFDGNGYTISNLVCESLTEDSLIIGSLFTTVGATGVIKNLTIKECTFDALEVACVAYTNAGLINNVHVIDCNLPSSSVYGISDINTGTISSCFVNSNINGLISDSAPICRTSDSGVVSNCYYISTREYPYGTRVETTEEMGAALTDMNANIDPKYNITQIDFKTTINQTNYISTPTLYINGWKLEIIDDSI